MPLNDLKACVTNKNLLIYFFRRRRGELLRAFNLLRSLDLVRRQFKKNVQALESGHILLNFGPSPISEGLKAGTFVHTWPFKSLNL